MHTTDHTDLEICTDCLMLLANGDVGDRGPAPAGTSWSDDDAHLYERDTDDTNENATARHARKVEAMWPTADGWHLMLGGDVLGFSYRWCDCCGSTLGGDRFTATAMQEVTTDTK
jgi:hypothetical protein